MESRNVRAASSLSAALEIPLDTDTSSPLPSIRSPTPHTFYRCTIHGLVSYVLQSNAIIINHSGIPSSLSLSLSLTSASPPCAPTPGQRIQILGDSSRTRCKESMSVAPATTPTTLLLALRSFQSLHKATTWSVMIDQEYVRCFIDQSQHPPSSSSIEVSVLLPSRIVYDHLLDCPFANPIDKKCGDEYIDRQKISAVSRF